jgi:hypothetical protein
MDRSKMPNGYLEDACMKVEKGQLGKSFSGSASALKNLIYFSNSSFLRICSDVVTYAYLLTWILVD